MGANSVLWVLQALLAFVFLFAGSAKLVQPIESIVVPVALPGLFLRFLGAAEVCGAIGLIVPGMLRIRPDLIVAAAGGLLCIMVGATVVTAIGLGLASACIPLGIGTVAAVVGYGRWRLVPISSRQQATTN